MSIERLITSRLATYGVLFGDPMRVGGPLGPDPMRRDIRCVRCEASGTLGMDGDLCDVCDGTGYATAEEVAR